MSKDHGPSNLRSAARELIEAIREFPPVGGCYSAIIKSRLVNALEDALEQPSPTPATAAVLRRIEEYRSDD